jgi:cytochrome P450
VHIVETRQDISVADSVLAEIFTPPGVDDPYPRYARLRAEAPVHRSADGVWYVSSYAACAEVVRAPEFGVAGRLAVLRPDWQDHPSLSLTANSMGVLDPPDHTRLRRLVVRAFTARRVAELRPTVERLVDGLLDGLGERGAGGAPVDFMAELALRLPIAVIGRLLGAPPELLDELGPLILRWIPAINPVSWADERVIPAADRAAVEIHELAAAMVAARRADQGDDLLTDLIRVEDGGERLSNAELLDTVNLLYVAGFLTTSHLLGNALVALMDAPEQAELLRTDPGCAGTAIEEFLRYDSPGQYGARTALRDTTVGGQRVSAGEIVMVMTGAANRDPAAFDRPDVLDLRRDPNPHLSFGGGIHYCLGAGLARMEATVALPALLRRFPGVRVAAGAQRAANSVFWGYRTLPVTV